MNAPFPPPNRAQDMSPVSNGSEWSGMNSYNPIMRTDSPYNTYSRADSVTPPESRPAYGSQQYRQNGFGPPPPEYLRQRQPSESGSRASSRAASVANSRSSDGTISDQQSRKYRRMEQELAQHYTVLKNYLRGGAQQPPRPNKARDKLLRLSPVQFHELSTDVFDELQRRQAMIPVPGRPQRQDNVPPFLQPRPDFHEKRNQARQKLSSLATSRFRDLSTDVFCELERRFPHFNRPESMRPQSRGPAGRPSTGPHAAPGFRPPSRNHGYGQSISPGSGLARGLVGPATLYENQSNGNDYGRPIMKQFHSNTITPNKSTMVEDEDELHGVDSRYDRSSDAFGLESSLTSPKSGRDTSATSQDTDDPRIAGKESQLQIESLQDELAELRATLRARDDELEQLRASGDVSSVARELGERLANTEKDNKSLREELSKLRTDNLTQRPDRPLQEENRSLREQLKQQQDIVDDVRKQGQLYLEEMRAMAESGGGSFEREDKLHEDVQRLENEVTTWKARYARAKTQLRNARAISLGLSISRPDITRPTRDEALYHDTGAVKDVHVTKFQIAIDELLQLARSGEPNAVLEHMKTVVLAVRNITTDIDNASEINGDEEMTKKRAKLKTKVSATANNVITASKNYVAAGGLSPVSLLDAAASHLTAAVVDLIRTVRIKPTPVGELEDDDDGDLEPLQGNGYFNITESLRRKSAVDSVYSALSAPEEVNGVSGPGPSVTVGAHQAPTQVNGNRNHTGLGINGGYDYGQDDSELQDLKMYVEDQSDHLVESIHALIEAIRRNESMPNIRSSLSRIVDTLENVIMTTERASTEVSSFQDLWQQETDQITQNLRGCNEKLLQVIEDSQKYDNQPTAKDFTQKIPPLAFQVARETRELVRRVQLITSGEGEEDFA